MANKTRAELAIEARLQLSLLRLFIKTKAARNLIERTADYYICLNYQWQKAKWGKRRRTLYRNALINAQPNGHHSESRHRRDAARTHNLMRRSIEEEHKADYWARRAAATVRRAENRLKTPQITRRIAQLEAGRRKAIHESDFRIWWKKQGLYLQSDLEYKRKPCEERTPLAITRKYFAGSRRRWKRWVVFYDLRLEYERALLAAASPLPVDQEDSPPLEKGGGVFYLHSWYEIKRVNKKSVTIMNWLGVPSMTWLAKKEEIKDVVSKARWEKR